MASIRFCMFSNWNGERLHSRPMGAFVRRAEDAIYFFTDDRAHKDEEIRAYPGFASPLRIRMGRNTSPCPARRKSIPTAPRSRNSGLCRQRYGGVLRIIRTFGSSKSRLNRPNTGTRRET